MICRTVRTQLRSFIERDLTERRYAAVKDHLAQCLECRQELLRLREIDLLMAADRGSILMPADLHRRIVEHVDRQTKGADEVVELSARARTVVHQSAAASAGAAGRAHGGPATWTRRARAVVSPLADDDSPEAIAQSVGLQRRLSWRAVAVITAALTLVTGAALAWGMMKPADPGVFGVEQLAAVAHEYPVSDFTDLNVLTDKLVAAQLAGTELKPDEIVSARVIQLMVADSRTLPAAQRARCLIDVLHHDRNIQPGAAETVTELWEQFHLLPQVKPGTPPAPTRISAGIGTLAVRRSPQELLDSLKGMNAGDMNVHERAIRSVYLADVYLKLGDMDACAVEVRRAGGMVVGREVTALVDAVKGSMVRSDRTTSEREQLLKEIGRTGDVGRLAQLNERLGDLYLTGGRYRDAANVFKGLVDQPGDAGLRSGIKLGLAWQEMGQIEPWRSLTEKLLERKPTQPAAQSLHVVALVERAMALHSGAAPEPLLAARYYEAALKECGTSWPWARASIGCVLVKVYMESEMPDDARRVVGTLESSGGLPVGMLELTREMAGIKTAGVARRP